MALVHTLALGGAVLAGTLSPLVAGAATGTVKNGSAAPDFVLKSIDGHNLRLSEYQGDVVVLVRIMPVGTHRTEHDCICAGV
jgi:hypothetical protein